MIVDVKKIREQKNLTQKELADFCGVTTRTVQNWENGSKIPEIVQKYLLSINGKDESISSVATNNSVSVSANQGSNVNVGKETERLLSLLEHSQKQIDAHLELARAKDTQLGKRDEQIDRLLTIVEDMSRRKEAQP